jgi:prepilin-type N-terminal cleavage/methylation domain-containing protein
VDEPRGADPDPALTGRRPGFSLVEILLTIVILSQVDQASTAAYDSLPVIAGCDSTLSGRVTIRGCISTDSLSNVLRRVRVVVSTSLPGSRPDTVTFQRARVRYPIPLR